MAFIEVRDVTKTYKMGEVEIKAVDEIGFGIDKGEFVVIVGPSGAGKTTILNILGGMDTATSGTIYVDNVDITKFNENELTKYRRDDVGFVFQFFNLIPSLTARENVELAASLVKSAMKADEALAMVGLEERAGHFPSQLSGGEQQRISVARAVVKRPDLLLCDEPTGALDSKNSIAVVKLLLDVRKRLNCPVMTITHNPEMARVADRIFHMKDGELIRIEDNEAPCTAEELDW